MEDKTQQPRIFRGIEFNPETGEILNEYEKIAAPEDKIIEARIIKAEQKEYVDNHILGFGNEWAYIRTFTDSVEKMKEILTNNEIVFTISLLPLVSYEDCIIRRTGKTKKSKILNMREISEAIGMRYDRARKIMLDLKKKGVIAIAETQQVLKNENEYKTKEVYLLNPYIFFKGKDLNNTVAGIFEDTVWAKFPDRTTGSYLNASDEV